MNIHKIIKVPKFPQGSMVHSTFFGYEGDYRVVGYNDCTPRYYYCIDRKGLNFCFPESYLEPYTEPEASTCTETCTDDCPSPKEEVSKMKPIESKVSVYLATEEEDEEFRMLLHENGFTWNTGTSLKGSSFWVNHAEESKVLYVHPDMTVTHWGNKTSDTLTFSEFKKRYFKCNDHIVQDHEMVDAIIKDGFKNHNRLHIAAMMAQAILTRIDDTPQVIAEIAFCYADVLLREAEKGGES